MCREGEARQSGLDPLRRYGNTSPTNQVFALLLAPPPPLGCDALLSAPAREGGATQKSRDEAIDFVNERLR
jgi:hypothetical protein